MPLTVMLTGNCIFEDRPIATCEVCAYVDLRHFFVCMLEWRPLSRLFSFVVCLSFRIRQNARIVAADMANQGYLMEEGVFSLPYADIIYTPQCWAEVKLARQKVDPDLDEMSIEEIEKAFEQCAGV